MFLHQEDSPNCPNERTAMFLLQLKLDYERAIAQTSSLIICETCRISNVYKVLGEDDRDIMSQKVEDISAKLQNREAQCFYVEQQLQCAQACLIQFQAMDKARSQEVETLKTKCSSLKTNMARTRAEKLSLMQDISRMELEGSQLNLQNVSHQSAIPETLALQRQTSLLEAEIQNHRSLQYAQLKKSNQSQEELCLNDWSGDPCHDISNQKPRRKVDKCTAPKVDLGKKQRGQKEEKQGYIPNFPHLQGQMTITTPGGAKLPQKLKQVLALPGDKSSFSVTPFLNRANINGIASDITSDEVGKSPLAGEQGFDREILCEKF